MQSWIKSEFKQNVKFVFFLQKGVKFLYTLCKNLPNLARLGLWSVRQGFIKDNSMLKTLKSKALIFRQIIKIRWQRYIRILCWLI